MSMRHLASESMKLEIHGMKSEIAELRAKLAIARKREVILWEGLKKYANADDWFSHTDFSMDGHILGDIWEFLGRGPIIAEEYIKAAEEVK